MKEFNLRIIFNKKHVTTIKICQKMKLRTMKIFLKEKFNVKEKFYLRQKQRILHNKDTFCYKFYKNNTEIDLIPIKNKNRACLQRTNLKILKTIATFFRYFLKIDINYFDNILNTLKYSNPLLFRFILAKKNYFIKMIYSTKNKFKLDEFTADPHIKNFFNMFETIFNKNKNKLNIKNYMEKKLSSENTQNNSSCCYNENNSKSSNISKNSYNSNNNYSNHSQFDDCIIQKCLSFNVINGNYEFFECDFCEKVNNFVILK